MSKVCEVQRRIRTMLEDLVADDGLDLVGVELLGPPGRHVLRISVERDPHRPGVTGSVSVEQCAALSREISPLLDVEDPVVGSYALEVSSPGIERPVQRAEDFVRFAGLRVRIVPCGEANRARITGVITGIDGDVLVLGTADGERRLALERVQRANLILTLEEFRLLNPALVDATRDEGP